MEQVDIRYVDVLLKEFLLNVCKILLCK